MSEGERKDPMRAAQANMRREPVRRFYRNVEVRDADGRHALTLDGRGARTPGRNPLAARSRTLMLRVAEEWARQGELLDPADMPLTRLLNSAIDGVARTMEETRAEIVRYAGSDLLCYRAAEPEALAERQRLAFDPVLDWAQQTLGVRFAPTAGVTHVEQPPAALAAVRAAVDRVDDPAALAALSAVTTLTGSAILALATAAGFSPPPMPGARPMSTRTSRTGSGASTTRRGRGERRAGGRWRRRRRRSPPSSNGGSRGAELHAHLDQGPAGDLRRGRGARDRRRGDADRCPRRERRDARADRRVIRRFAPRRAARAGQRPPSFLPDFDARSSAGDQQAALPLARRALSDLVAPHAGPPAPRGAARADRASDVRLHDRRRPPLSLSGRASKTRSTSRSRRRSNSACA